MEPHPLAVAGREILWNIDSWQNQLVMYALCILSAAVCLFGLWRRIRLWVCAKPDPSRRGELLARFAELWDYTLGPRGVNRERVPAVFHSLLFLGFIVLLFATTVVLIENDFGIPIYHGRFYLAVTLLADTFGLGLLVGVLYALYRRYVLAPDRLHNSRGDFTALVILALMVVQGFVLEGLRIHVTQDPWALYSPVGYAVSLFFWGVGPSAAQLLHYLMWWFHTLTVFVFIALVPYTKFFHIVSSSANVFFGNYFQPKGALKHPGDIEALMEQALSEDNAEEEFRFGASTLSDLTWKQRLDFDACTACGRCQEACPAYRSGKPLSPKWLMLDAREHMLKLQASSDAPNSNFALRKLDSLDQALLKKFVLEQHVEGATRGENEAVQNCALAIGDSEQAELAGEVLDENVFWSCTSCRACMEVCPVCIEHVPLIMEVRRSLALMQGSIPSEAQSALRAIETRGNPFGPAESRTEWTEGLQVPILEEGAEVDVLYWVGCLSAFDREKQGIARAMAAILNASGLRWGILGNREKCSGDPARRLGEENLFQSMAKQNIETLSGISFHTLVANCPHCFNTLAHEYRQIGDYTNGKPIRVLHHSQLIFELIEQGRIRVAELELPPATFHDPCYLGRYNDIYQAPRKVLSELGAKPIREMKDNQENGLCCGAGGGHYWFDLKIGSRINCLRVEQANEIGAELIASACPFCHQMLDDALKLTEHEEKMKVCDIAELVAEALE